MMRINSLNTRLAPLTLPTLFKLPSGMMEMMVSKLVDRGDVETVVPTSCCGGDCGCSSEDHGKHYKLTLKAFREMEA